MIFLKEKKFNIITAIKYLFPIVFFAIASVSLGNIGYLILGLLETTLVFAVLMLIMKLYKAVGYFLSIPALFLLYAQAVVLVFGTSYVTLLMLTNLDSLYMLKGKAVLYIGATILVLVIVFLPMENVLEQLPAKISAASIGAVALAWIICVAVIGKESSPFLMYGVLAKDAYDKVQNDKKIDELMNSEVDKEFFYKDSVLDGLEKPESLPENPNVVLIFIEGCSQANVSDDRNFMPNVAKFQQKGMNFINYYNHTAATYRGIVGQLNSGYQFDNMDSNNLISVEDIMKEKGYHTSFFNSEPNNKDFTAYLNGLGFDEVCDSGTGKITNDEDTFDCVFDRLKEAEESGQPEFLATYTVGTHVSFDSSDQVFGDGSNRYINKFYNFDYHFGRFMEKLEAEGYDENTLVILTTDHATNADSDWHDTFDGHYERGQWFLDTIPMTFYYKGIDAWEVDAGGRTSMDLAPTLLDYLDISAPNYFLGTSVFATPKTNYDYVDTTFCIPESMECYRTEVNVVRTLNEDEFCFYKTLVLKYCAVAKNS